MDCKQANPVKPSVVLLIFAASRQKRRSPMAPLRFCANISWLFTELPDFSQRIYAAAAAGFQAVEAGWLYDCDLPELQRAKEATGVEVVLINTPPGNHSTDAGLSSDR